MRPVLTLLTLLYSLTLWSETIESQVHSIDNQFGFLRLTNGRVVFLNQSLVNLIPDSAETFEVTVDENNILNQLTPVGNKRRRHEDKNLILFDPPVYEATVLPDLKTVRKMFSRLNPKYKRLSECTDRAHIWSYDEFRTNGIKSMKAFILFTASYINRHHFKWWFHVAPMVYVQHKAQIESRILDFRFIDRPVSVKEWSDLFVFSKRPCKVTTKFSEYDVNPQTEDCYMIYESMYYRLPGDVYDQERLGTYETAFNLSEVNFARSLAFEKEPPGDTHE